VTPEIRENVLPLFVKGGLASKIGGGTGIWTPADQLDGSTELKISELYKTFREAFDARRERMGANQ